MKKLLLVLLAASLLVTAGACAAAETAKQTGPTGDNFEVGAPPGASSGDRGTTKPQTTYAPAPTTTTTTQAGVTYSSAGIPQERMIIRTANLQLVVTDVAAAISQIASLANSYGGYVVSSNSWKENDRLIGNVSFRVTADRFEAAIGALHDLADDVRSESTSGQDVTEEYVDLAARLGNLEAAEAQLLELMKQAGEVVDILEVQRELVKTRGEIEQTKGRMQYLEQSSAMSFIQVTLEQSKLSVEFVARNRNVREGETVYFDPVVSGGFGPYSFEWDFGDSETSTDSNPSHGYKSDGNYTISLKVTDDRGNIESQTRADYITVMRGWDAGNTASSAWRGMVVFSHGFVNSLIWLGILSPIWIILIVILYFAWWRRRRKPASGA